MSEREKSHVSHKDGESDGEEVIFKEGAAGVENSTAPTTSPEMVTKSDLQEIIEGWKAKFHQLSEGICAIQMASEQLNTHMDNLQRDSHVREGAQERRIQDMQEGLARFLERCDPAHLAAVRPFDSPCAPVMSTPFTPSGVPFRHHPDFQLRVSRQPIRANGVHVRQRETTTVTSVPCMRTTMEIAATPSSHLATPTTAE